MRRPTLAYAADPQAPPAVRRGNRRAAVGGPTAVVRGEWVDPDDVRPDARRKPRTIEGWRCLCVLRRIMAAGGDVTYAHIRSADWLRQRADLARVGYSRPLDAFEPPTVAPGPRAGPSDAAVAQATAAHDVEVALRPFTAGQCRMLDAIVLSSVSVQAWSLAEAERVGHRVDTRIEQGKLIGCLDILSKHIEGDIEEAEQHGQLPPD